MDNLIEIATINDFIFCPISIYFHNLMGGADKMLTQSTYQINGTHAHSSIDEHRYSSKKSILMGISVFCDKYGLVGKIDLFDTETGLLTERKKHLSAIYPGHIYQMYAQYYSLTEMGYCVNSLKLYSMDDNKNYFLDLPDVAEELRLKFEETITSMRTFDPLSYSQTNPNKCRNCIYEPMCGGSCLD